jgi:hypothetical protein
VENDSNTWKSGVEALAYCDRECELARCSGTATFAEYERCVKQRHANFNRRAVRAEIVHQQQHDDWEEGPASTEMKHLVPRQSIELIIRHRLDNAFPLEHVLRIPHSRAKNSGKDATNRWKRVEKSENCA